MIAKYPSAWKDFIFRIAGAKNWKSSSRMQLLSVLRKIAEHTKREAEQRIYSYHVLIIKQAKITCLVR